MREEFLVACGGGRRYIPAAKRADVAELADAQPSGGCDRKVVEVRILSSAPNVKMQTQQKFLVTGLLGAFLFVVHADAGSVNDVTRWTGQDRYMKALSDPTSPASRVDLPMVDMKKAAPVKGFSVTPQEINMRPTPSTREVNTVETRNVELKQRNFSSRDINTRGMPVTNFTAKRASANDRLPAETKLRPIAERAPVSERVINTGTPEGREELKDQLNRRP